MSQPVWNYAAGFTTFSGEVGSTIGAITGGATPAGATWPANNDAILVPFVLNQPTLIKRLFSVNGNVASGNIDMGIYTKDGARISSIGSTAQSGTNGLQFFDVTDFVLGYGYYYLAVALSSTVGTLFRANLTVARLQAMGCAKMASAFPLPTTITFAAVTSGYLPFVGVETFRIL